MIVDLHDSRYGCSGIIAAVRKRHAHVWDGLGVFLITDDIQARVLENCGAHTGISFTAAPNGRQKQGTHLPSGRVRPLILPPPWQLRILEEV